MIQRRKLGIEQDIQSTMDLSENMVSPKIFHDENDDGRNLMFIVASLGSKVDISWRQAVLQVDEIAGRWSSKDLVEVIEWLVYPGQWMADSWMGWTENTDLSIYNIWTFI